MDVHANGSVSSGRARIAQASFIDVNGAAQWVTMRGWRGGPVVLVLHGTGYAYSPMTPFFEPWEEHLTLVQWDQPGAGATYVKSLEGRGPLSFERFVADGIAVAEHVRERLDVERVALLAVSGGTVPGLLIAHRRPDLVSAYVGTGQVVNWARQESLSYELLLDAARKRTDMAAAAELESIGPPPYVDAATDAIKSKYAAALTKSEQEAFATAGSEVMGALRNPPADATYVPHGLERHDGLSVAMAAYTALRPELRRFDARQIGGRFDVPMHFVQGEQDLYTVTSEVEAYARDIEAPLKSFTAIPGGGHSVVFMRQAFLDQLRRRLG